MSEENNIYENNNEETQYTQAPEPDYTQAPETTINGEVYTGETADYSSGKGQGKGLGIASMVCGIVSLIGCCGLWYIGIPCAIVAIILGIIQIVKNESKGMAIAGIICGAIGIILSVLVLVGAMALLSSGALDEALKEAGYY